MSYQRLLKIRGIILVWLCLCWQEFPIQIGEETPDSRLSSRKAPSPSSSTYHRQGCKLRGDTIYLLSKAERKRVETESSVLAFIFQFHFTVKKKYEFTQLLVIGNMFKVVAMIDLCHKNRKTVWTKVQWRICFCFLMITDRTIQSLMTN